MAAAIAWQLEPFLAEKVERGRRLLALAESEEHRGNPDLQVGLLGLAEAAAQAAGFIRSASVRLSWVSVTPAGARRASSRATCPVWPKTKNFMSAPE